jgi:mitochondrial translocator assembly and maintenance protein 41
MKSLRIFFRRQLSTFVSQEARVHDSLHEVMDGFRAPVRFAAAYGSGAYPQKGYENLKPGKDVMIDFIFGVTHAQHWHSLNLRQNQSHYSLVSRFGPSAVASLQENFGGRIYYNTDVVVNGVRIKYGVVSMNHLLADLNNWETLYLAGRMHKRTFY